MHVHLTLLSCLLAGLAGQGGMTDEEIQERVRTYHELEQALLPELNTSFARFQQTLHKLIGDLDLSELSAQQLAVLFNEGPLRYPGQEAPLLSRLELFRDDRGEAGAIRAVIRLALLGPHHTGRNTAPEVQELLLREVLSHPGLDAAMKSGTGAALFGAIRQTSSPEVWKRHAEALLGLQRFLEPRAMVDRAALNLPGYFEVVEAVSDDEALRERIRAKALERCSAALGRAHEQPAYFQEPFRYLLEVAVDSLSPRSPAERMVGQPAPELTFHWSSDGELRRLSDLRGKVVLLDFWATWCAPCVASFPKLRRLAAHYADADFEIVGVTSLQGRHIDGESVVTKDDPELEVQLMGEYVRARDLPWTVAFSEADLFDRRYLVQGVPHVVLVDKQGVVRRSHIPPGLDLEGLKALIDPLLE